jgi:hypothetical protein
MSARASLLPGLPGTGPLPITSPASWARLGREGTVVEFRPLSGPVWVGNFAPGLGIETAVLPHPDGIRVLVLAHGSVYEVSPDQPVAVEESTCSVTGYWAVPESPDYLLALNHIELVRWGATGPVWRSGRISWDGFEAVRIEGDKVVGQACEAPGEIWVPFTVSLAAGTVTGGARYLR